MVELEIDGKKVEVLEGSMVMHAAEKLGTYIPHFCYHKKLHCGQLPDVFGRRGESPQGNACMRHTSHTGHDR